MQIQNMGLIDKIQIKMRCRAPVKSEVPPAVIVYVVCASGVPIDAYRG
jgi:hypothetical protein